MAETSEVASKHETPKPQNNLFSFIPKIDLKFPLFNNINNKQEPKSEVVVAKEESKTSTKVVVGDEEAKLDVVRFSERLPIIPPPLKLENEEAEKSTSPMVLWQVYAFGGYLILRWAWARWKEREGQKGPSDDQESGTDE